MIPNLNSILEAALQLPAEEKAELISQLSLTFPRKKTPGNVRKHFGTFNSGDPRSCDNDKIDADLAKSYLDTHEFEN